MESDLDLDFEHYTVAWIAPLEIEAQAAWYMLDHEYPGSFSTNRGDDYVYMAGDINGHNVVIATFPAGHNYGVDSAVALASQLLASASCGGTVRLWDAKAGTLQRTLEGHSDWVWAVAFSPDGQLLASASRDVTVRLWDAKVGALQCTLEGHSGWVSSVAFSPDGQLLASAADDGTVMLWDTKAGALQRKLEISSIISLTFSIDGSRLETNKGPIELGITPLDPNPSISWSQSLYSLNDSKSWVMWNGHNILWLPPEYRPTCEKVQGNILAMGHASGRVTIARFNPDTIPIL